MSLKYLMDDIIPNADLPFLKLLVTVVILAILVGIASQVDHLVTKTYPVEHEIKNFTMYDQPDGVSAGASAYPR